MKQDPLHNVFWIGGGSGAGKSTIAKLIAQKYGYELYSCDEAMAEHGRRLNQKTAPLLEKFKHMSMDERWLNRSPEEMLKTFHWFCGEGFECIIEDMQKRTSTTKIIVEGFRIRPDLLLPYLTHKNQAIWLIPTPDFRKHALKSRNTLWDIPHKTSNPQKALENILRRDALFTDSIYKSAKDKNLKTILIDGKKSKDDLVKYISQLFKIDII